MPIRLNNSETFCITERVEEHAASAPNSLAVQAGADRLTYSELNSRSTALAKHLCSVGAGPDSLIGILLDRSLSSVISCLAVLKAGAAYLPLDPAVPTERLAFMLRDSGVSSVITRCSLADKLPSGSWNVLCVDAELPTENESAIHNVAAATGRDLAYVIYTSGSTGQPKGVEITRAGLQNLVNWHLRAFQVTAGDRATLMASFGFDAAVWELWPYLAAGASVHIPADDIRTNIELLRKWLVEQGITISFVATPLAELLIQTEWPSTAALRILLTGADTLHRRPRKGLPFTFVNNYGPTENTVVSTSGTVMPDEIESRQPSIGKAIDNTEVFVLDEQMRPLAPGVAGELYIGGCGLARGYRNRPELTAEKFVPNPFANGTGSARLYRTGDRARMLANGEVEFLGRLDDQVKIRGYRVELDEINSVLNSHPEVKAGTAVLAEAPHGDKKLIAYLVLNPTSNMNSREFREYLQSRVPEYMIPSVFVRLHSLPLTSNGKVDRAGLPVPNGNTLPEEPYIAPRTPIEQRLAELISPLLHVERVGVNDNFFLLGGHSLLGTQLLTRISESFGVELSLLTIFDHPTLAGMSAEIEKLILAKLEVPAVAHPAGEYR